MMEYHIYAGPALDRVFEYLKSKGQPLPNRLLCVAYTAEEDGEIKSLAIIQSLPVVGPFIAEPGFGYTLRRLFKQSHDFIVNAGAKRVLMTPEHPAMKLMLERVGAEPFDGQVYVWRREEDLCVSESADQAQKLTELLNSTQKAS